MKIDQKENEEKNTRNARAFQLNEAKRNRLNYFEMQEHSPHVDLTNDEEVPLAKQRRIENNNNNNNINSPVARSLKQPQIRISPSVAPSPSFDIPSQSTVAPSLSPTLPTSLFEISVLDLVEMIKTN